MSDLKNGERQALNEDDLNNVSGGAISYAGKYAGDGNRPWEVLDSSGNVVARCKSEQEAKDWIAKSETKYSTTKYNYYGNGRDYLRIEDARRRGGGLK